MLLGPARDTTDSANGQRARNTEAQPQPEAATVTLMLTPDEVQMMFMAETHGQIRFSLRSFGDDDDVEVRPFLLQVRDAREDRGDDAHCR